MANGSTQVCIAHELIQVFKKARRNHIVSGEVLAQIALVIAGHGDYPSRRARQGQRNSRTSPCQTRVVHLRMKLEAEPVAASFSMPEPVHEGLPAVMKPSGTTWTSSLCDSHTVWVGLVPAKWSSAVDEFNFHGAKFRLGDSRASPP